MGACADRGRGRNNGSPVRRIRRWAWGRSDKRHIVTEDQTGAAEPPLTVPLCEGGPLTLARDVLSVPGVELPVFAIAWIGLVPDPGETMPDGAPQMGMGIGVRVRDGGAYYFVPMDSDNGARLLDALFTLRPALRIVPPPVAGAFAAQPRWISSDHSPSSEQQSSDPAVNVPTSEERVLAALAHLSVVLLPIVLPLVIYLAARRSAPYAAQQAKQALGFQSIDAVLGVLMFLLVNAVAGPAGRASELGFAVLAIAAIALLVFTVSFSWAHAARRAFAGEEFHYPLLGWF